MGLESSICSVEGCLRDAIGFMWADEGDIQALRYRPGLSGGQNRAEELKDELQKCIFHTDKENEIWIENWDGEMERWKRDRDEVLGWVRMLGGQGLNETIDNLNRILENRPKDYEWRSERVREFWRLIRNYRDVEFNPNSNDQDGRWGITQGGTYRFSLFVFPEFEEGDIERNENGDLIVQRDFSFWSENEIYGFTQDAYFSEATFTQRGIFENINISSSDSGNLTLSRLNLPSDTSQIILRNVRLRDLTISSINRRLTPDNFLIHNLDVSDPNGTINFESVYLEDLKFVNVDWGDVSTRRISPGLYRDNPRAARDIYRQIKLALDKQENYIDARKFYALEIQAHGRELETELRDRSFPPISWIFAGIIHFSNALLGDSDFITTLSLQVASASLKTLSVLLYLVPALGLFFLVAYYTSYAPIVLALLLLLLILPHHRVPVLRSLGAFNSLIIYYLYGLTAGFGLSWVRPLLWLVGTVAVYTYLNNHLYQIYCDIALRIPENVRDVVVNAVYNISKNLNEFALNLLQFLPNQYLSNPDHPFLTLVFFVLSSYLIYQTIVALRRRVRR